MTSAYIAYQGARGIRHGISQKVHGGVHLYDEGITTAHIGELRYYLVSAQRIIVPPKICCSPLVSLDAYAPVYSGLDDTPRDTQDAK